jgi:Ca2+/Na+ antiporter
LELLKLNNMEWYFYLNYVIYRFYKRKKDNTPVFRAFFVTILLIAFNLLTIRSIYFFIKDFSVIPQSSGHYKIEGIVFFSFLGLINYLLLYRKKKYEDVFWEFQNNYDKYKKWDKSVKWYIILSIVTTIVVSIIADIRNHYVKGLI